MGQSSNHRRQSVHGAVGADALHKDDLRAVADRVFLEILSGWDELLRSGNVDQGAWVIERRVVGDQLAEGGRVPAFVINGSIAQVLRAVRCGAVRERDRRQAAGGRPWRSTSSLYAAIADLCPGASSR